MKKSIILILCLGAFNANAGLVSYSDRATFDSVYSGLSVEDFEDIVDISQVLSSTNIESGLTLSLTSGTNAYLAAPGQSANSTTAIGVNIPSSAGWALDFSTAVNAVSFDIFQNSGGGNQFGFNILADVEVFGSSGILDSFSATIPSGSAGFFGVVSDSDLITRVTVNAPNSYDVIDNVAFGQVSSVSVPEPTSLAILGLALAGLGYSRKRK